MPRYFKDPDSSQYHLAGNLLLGAEAVHVEELVRTSFSCDYRLDVAITSKQVTKNPILLGGVEIGAAAYQPMASAARQIQGQSGSR